MKRRPLYIFDELKDTGIHMVPVNSMIHLKDNGAGKPLLFSLIRKPSGGFNGSTTIANVLSDNNLYCLLDLWEHVYDPTTLTLKIIKKGLNQ